MTKELTGWKCKACGTYEEKPVRTAEYTDKINLAVCPTCGNKTFRRIREILEFELEDK
jgi:ribosomal protein L32